VVGWFHILFDIGVNTLVYSMRTTTAFPAGTVPATVTLNSCFDCAALFSSEDSSRVRRLRRLAAWRTTYDEGSIVVQRRFFEVVHDVWDNHRVFYGDFTQYVSYGFGWFRGAEVDAGLRCIGRFVLGSIGSRTGSVCAIRGLGWSRALAGHFLNRYEWNEWKDKSNARTWISGTTIGIV
jgi:hypothetical protein